jgi:hypothetical protein
LAIAVEHPELPVITLTLLPNMLPATCRSPLIPAPPCTTNAPENTSVLVTLLVKNRLLDISVLLLVFQKKLLLSPLKLLLAPANCTVPGGPKLGVFLVAVSWKLPSGNSMPLVSPAALAICMLPYTLSVFSGTPVPMPNRTLALSNANKLLPVNKLSSLNCTLPLLPPGGV